MPTTTASAGRTERPLPKSLPASGEGLSPSPSGGYAPSVLVTPETAAIEDGGGYGDPLPDGRPDFVREDDRRKS